MYQESELMWQKSMIYRICDGQSISVKHSWTKHKLTARQGRGTQEIDIKKSYSFIPICYLAFLVNKLFYVN